MALSALKSSQHDLKKTSPVIETDFTERVLMSLLFDVSKLDKSVERIKVQVYALAREHGIDTPDCE